MSIEQTGRPARPAGGAVGLAFGVLSVAAWAAPTDREQLARLVKAAPAEQQAARDAGRKAASSAPTATAKAASANMAKCPIWPARTRCMCSTRSRPSTGKRKDAFMQGLMKVLSAQEKANIALFYAAQPVPPAVPEAGPRAAEGREHFVRNCVRCHGAEARGGENFRASPASRPNTCAAI
jgi:cytochrome c553